jgi:hypothetical protein
MISYARLSQKPGIFKGFSGVTVAEFRELEAKVEPQWLERERKRLQRPERQRAAGGGRKPELPMREQLLMTMVWLRLYLTTEVLGYLFGVDKATVSRYTRAMLPALRAVGEETLGWSEPPKRGQGKNLAKAREAYPDLFAFVDATEQPVRRPSQQEKQEQYYSGKKKRHTCKTQIVVNEYGEVRDVSISVAGSVHDRKLFSVSGVADKIPQETTVGGDRGYVGIQDDLPDHNVLLPFKSSKHHPLTDEQKLLNQEFSSSRLIAENVLAQFKHFKVLADTFRHDRNHHDDAFRSVLAVVNPRIQKRVAAALAA